MINFSNWFLEINYCFPTRLIIRRTQKHSLAVNFLSTVSYSNPALIFPQLTISQRQRPFTVSSKSTTHESTNWLVVRRCVFERLQEKRKNWKKESWHQLLLLIFVFSLLFSFALKRCHPPFFLSLHFIQPQKEPYFLCAFARRFCQKDASCSVNDVVNHHLSVAVVSIYRPSMISETFLNFVVMIVEDYVGMDGWLESHF